jgi:hypothetical protein
MHLAHKIIVFGLAVILKSESIFACPPPILPQGWKPPTWDQTIATEFKRAQTVATIEVTNVTFTQTPVENALVKFTNKGSFRPIKVYKGAIEILSNPFELERTNIDCDHRPTLGEAGMKIVFINSKGEINFAVYSGDRYQLTIDELEKIIR